MIPLYKGAITIGLRNKLLNFFALHPPNPSTYQIDPETQEILMTSDQESKDLFQKAKETYPEGTLKWIDLNHKNAGAIKITQNPSENTQNVDRKTNFTMIYTHGNNIDLGYVLPFFMELSSKTQMDVLLVEYCGYGPFQDTHTITLDHDLEILKSYEACYDYLRTEEAIPAEEIIFGGFSLGTGPATFAASHPDFEGAGLLIEGPFSSGLRVKNQSVSIFSIYVPYNL